MSFILTQGLYSPAIVTQGYGVGAVVAAPVRGCVHGQDYPAFTLAIDDFPAYDLVANDNALAVAVVSDESC